VSTRDVTTPPPRTAQPAVRDQEYEAWLRCVRDQEDLAALVRILAPVLPGIPLHCRCTDATCDRCLLERIVNERRGSRPPPPARPRDPPF
jgi:hypothetical protein